MSFIWLAVFTALCVAFVPARPYAALGLGALLYLYPWETAGLLLIAGVALLLIRHHRRRKSHGRP